MGELVAEARQLLAAQQEKKRIDVAVERMDKFLCDLQKTEPARLRSIAGTPGN